MNSEHEAQNRSHDGWRLPVVVNLGFYTHSLIPRIFQMTSLVQIFFGALLLSTVKSEKDSDGDGLVDSLDTDDNDNGISDILDNDDDGNGILDFNEDDDGDGLSNFGDSLKKKDLPFVVVSLHK